MSIEQAFIIDNNMLRSLANGESKAFQDVYRDCFPIVTRSLQNMSAQLMEAEEIYHESLLVLYEKGKDPNFILSCKISTFLVSVARKKWLKQLEKQKRLSEKELNYARVHENDNADAHFNFDLIQKQETKLKKLQDALAELGEPCKNILQSFYIDNLSMKEIAKQNGYTNADNAKTQKHKCLNRLKTIFFK